jgi:glycosyltransferase involved in cell wall biosynthesis
MSPRRSIRVVVHRYGREILGGSESLVRRLVLAMHHRGWEVEVLTTTAGDEATWRPAYPTGRAQDEGVCVRRFEVPRARRPAAFHQLSRAFFRLPSWARPEALWIRAQGPVAPDLVHALASEADRPTLFTPYLYHPTLCGLPAAPHPRILMPAAHDEPALRLRAVGRAIAASDALWLHTDEERDLLVAVHPQADTLPYAVGTVAVDAPDRVDPGAFRAHHDLGAYLLYGGRMTPGKGLDELLSFFRELHRRRPEIQLVLTGEVSTGTRGMPGVRQLGRLDDADRWAAIRGSTAVVVPSAMESLSLLALEAWSMGRPAMLNAASPVLAGQARRSGGGLVYADAGEFAAAAELLLDNPAKGEALGESGRAFVRRDYQWDAVIGRLEGLLEACREAGAR